MLAGQGLVFSWSLLFNLLQTLTFAIWWLPGMNTVVNVTFQWGLTVHFVGKAAFQRQTSLCVIARLTSKGLQHCSNSWSFWPLTSTTRHTWHRPHRIWLSLLPVWDRLWDILCGLLWDPSGWGRALEQVKWEGRCCTGFKLDTKTRHVHKEWNKGLGDLVSASAPRLEFKPNLMVKGTTDVFRALGDTIWHLPHSSLCVAGVLSMVTRTRARCLQGHLSALRYVWQFHWSRGNIQQPLCCFVLIPWVHKVLKLNSWVSCRN